MKKLLLLFLFAGLALHAQTPPTPPAPSGPPSPSPTPGPTRDPLTRPLTRPIRTNAPSPAIIGRPTLTNASPSVTGAAPVPGRVPAVNAPPVPGAIPATQPSPAAAAANSAAAADDVPDEFQPGTIDFLKMDLDQVLTFYEDLVRRTILRPASLPATQISLRTKTKLTRQEAIQAIDAVLGLNGIAMVNVGEKFVKALPLANVGQAATPFSKGSPDLLPDMGQYVTEVIQVTNVRPTDIVQALTPFASAIPNPILAIEGSQILVLRDFSENVKRMLEMVKKIDVAIPSEYTSEVIPIKYALASEIAGALNSLSSGGGGATIGAAVTGAGGMGARGMGGRGGGFGRTGGLGSGYPGTTQPGMNPMGATTPGAPGATGGSFTDRLRSIINKGGTSATGDIQVIGQTKIIADERTNSLLIYASKDDMKTIKHIIEQLDVVLAQVLIEAVIIEVSLDNNSSLGVSYQEARNHGLGNYFNGIGAVNNGNMLSQSTFFSGAGTNGASALPGGFSYLAQLGQDLNIAVTAAAGDSRARILQRPRIQTSHAVPASLFVGESRPYPTGSYYGGGAYGGYSSIQQMQIGVSIEVTPLINPDGLVVMDIHQKIDSVSGSVNIANIGDVPITSSKEAQAKVAVRDRDTIILGGLIETTKNQSHSGVPFLKDVPVLGVLFRSNSDQDTRSELIVLIRPTVLPTPEVAALAARAEKDKMPGVRRAERENQIEENQRIRAADRDLKGKATFDPP